MQGFFGVCVCGGEIAISVDSEFKFISVYSEILPFQCERGWWWRERIIPQRRLRLHKIASCFSFFLFSPRPFFLILLSFVPL